MESGSIQLPYGFVRDKNPGGELHFDLHQNFKKELLFKKQPYVAHLEYPAINNVVIGGKVDSLALQKFLLATDLLQDSIQENLDMIVTDGSFNNASVSRALGTKFPSVMKKPNPVVIFKDKSKFDAQNPVISSLITQVVDNKKKVLHQAPSIKDLDIEKRFQELKNFNKGRINNDDDDDDDNNAGQLPGGASLPLLQYLSLSASPFCLHVQLHQQLL